MTEIIRDYIGKECAVHTMDAQITGTLRHVSDGWLAIDTGRGPEAVNLEYVVRIRPTPKRRGEKS